MPSIKSGWLQRNTSHVAVSRELTILFISLEDDSAFMLVLEGHSGLVGLVGCNGLVVGVAMIQVLLIPSKAVWESGDILPSQLLEVTFRSAGPMKPAASQKSALLQYFVCPQSFSS